MASQAPQEREVLLECQGPKDTEVIQDVQGLQGQPASLDPQVSKVPEAEREVLGFKVSRVHLAIPAKEALQGYQGNRGSLGPRGVQVPQVGKDSEGMWGLRVQLE